jgi:hypothetical protein
MAAEIGTLLSEEEIYRVDHYLGKRGWERSSWIGERRIDFLE